MSDMPLPEPTEEDEELALEFIRLRDETNLRGTPGGRQRCEDCHFYADPAEPIAYCWHDHLQILVGGSWRCDRWQQVGAPDEQVSLDDRTTAARLHADKVEDQQWLAHPDVHDEQCGTCMYYLNPDESVSYCWHRELQVGVGLDHSCRWWEQIPGRA